MTGNRNIGKAFVHNVHAVENKRPVREITPDGGCRVLDRRCKTNQQYHSENCGAEMHAELESLEVMELI